jgi:hypothetical protein
LLEGCGSINPEVLALVRALACSQLHFAAWTKRVSKVHVFGIGVTVGLRAQKVLKSVFPNARIVARFDYGSESEDGAADECPESEQEGEGVGGQM